MKIDKITRNQFISNTEKLVLENFHNILEQIDSTYSSINELSPEVKHNAFHAANAKYNQLDRDKAPLHKTKLAKQAEKFATHVDPAIKTYIETMANKVNLLVSVEKGVAGGDDTQFVKLYFNVKNDNMMTNEYNFEFKVTILADTYSFDKNKDYQMPPNFDRVLMQIIKKVQAAEFSKHF